MQQAPLRGGKPHPLNFIDQRLQRVERSGQIGCQSLLDRRKMFVRAVRHPRQCPRAVQRIASRRGKPLVVLRADRMFALVAAARAAVQPGIGSGFPPPPQEGLCFHLLPTARAGGPVKRTDVRLKPLLAAFRRRERCQGGLEFGRLRRGGQHIQQKNQHRIDRADQHAPAAARQFQHAPRRRPKRIQHPPARLGQRAIQTAHRDPCRQRRQKASQRQRVLSDVTRQVRKG